MMDCLKCASVIEKNDLYYLVGDMGPDITTILEKQVQLLDENGAICSQCFAHITKELSVNPNQQNELQCPRSNSATILCVWCRKRLGKGRCHSVTEGPERHFISERISPRQIPEGAVACHLCWTKARKTLRRQGVSYVPSANRIVCVWCLRSLANRRSHSIPEGPERNEIIAKIHPREIPPGGCVCYACWVAACRIVQRAANVKDGLQDARPSHQHYGVDCAWCKTSLFKRQVRILREGRERDVVAEKIYPNKLPEHAFLCVDCWARAQEHVLIVDGNVEQLRPPNPILSLADYRHTTNSSSHCFVPSCTNTERLSVPEDIRKRILQSQKIFVTENSRICAEHKSVCDWDFLNKYQFSTSFTGAEIKSMLNLTSKF